MIYLVVRGVVVGLVVGTPLASIQLLTAKSPDSGYDWHRFFLFLGATTSISLGGLIGVGMRMRGSGSARIMKGYGRGFGDGSTVEVLLYSAGTTVLPLADVPANQDLLAYRRLNAKRPHPKGDMALDGWRLNTHPDLVEHLSKLAPDPRDVVPVYGVPVIVANGIAAVVALGTDWLVFRLPEPPVDVELNSPIPSLKSSNGWHSVRAWQSGVSIPEAHGKLRALIRDAMRYAATLA
ncbi:hypothetical protein [Frankia gtarii]|uniref:hypothetical protein n=1 Tax=Frankia gtarii TaxID=2950102 RepID=UPI0021C251CD|nr:hypothetical protein [Frankia gtarii]